MKIIEAMKKIKANKEKIADLQQKISSNSANLSLETPLYGTETSNKIKEWAQSCEDIGQDNIKLLVAIAKTNLVTSVTIELGEKKVTKTIAEWVWRRREYANIDLSTWSKMTDRNLKEGQANFSIGQTTPVTLIRHYDPVLRDAKTLMYKSEPRAIDAALEVVNAITDLVE